MRADLDELLAGSTSEPRTPLDVDELWSAGRRRRRVRRLSAVTGGVASVAVVVVAVSAIGLSGPSSPEVSPLDQSDGSDDTEVADTDETGDLDESAPAVPSDETGTDDGEPTGEATGDEATDGEGSDEAVDATADPADEPAATDEPTPTPDAAAMDDPCAAHDADDIRAFIDVVSPVTGQSIGDAIELVGCSSVYEGTVRYRVLDGDEVLVDDFTTATAGGPALGEFRETIVIDRSGALTLEVFWDSPADGSEQDLVQLTIQGS